LSHQGQAEPTGLAVASICVDSRKRRNLLHVPGQQAPERRNHALPNLNSPGVRDPNGARSWIVSDGPTADACWTQQPGGHQARTFTPGAVAREKGALGSIG
jgi:hypothetical protein